MIFHEFRDYISEMAFCRWRRRTVWISGIVYQPIIFHARYFPFCPNFFFIVLLYCKSNTYSVLKR